MEIPNDKKKVFTEFDSLVRCRHGSKSYDCSLCKTENWHDSLSESGQTIGQIINYLVEQRKIDRLELEEYVGKKMKRKRIKKVAVVSGVAIAGGLLLYEGGKLIYRLFGRKERK